MGLNIKNEQVCALAREASARTGLSQTAVIGQALTAYLAGLPETRNDRLEQLRAFLTDFDARTAPSDVVAMRTAAEHMYDDQYPTQ